MKDSWEVKNVSDFGDIITGSTPSTKNMNFWDGEYPFYSPADFNGKVYCLQTERTITELGLRTGRILPKNSVMFTCIGSIGKMAISDSIGISNQQINAIIVNDSLDFKYIYYLLFHYKDRFKNFAPMTTIQIINKTEFGQFKFNLPPLPQQRKIAEILSMVDAVLEKTEAAIAKYQQLKQGLMHDVFTRGINTNTGQLRPKQTQAPELYKQSPLGWIPKEWEVNSLEELTSYVDYRGKTPPKAEKGIFLITAKNIKFGYIDYEISKEFIPISAYKSAMSRGIPQFGDVLITTEAPLGNVAQIDKEGLALAQRVIKYRCIEGLMLNDFLKHSLMSEYFQKELEAESTGSTVKGIKGSRLHKLQVFNPNIKEQKAIVESLNPVERKIDTEQQALAKYQQLKAGLLQDLLTGKVEV